MNGTKTTTKAVMNAAEAAISDPGVIAKIEDQRRSLKYERYHCKNDASKADDTQQNEEATVARTTKNQPEGLTPERPTRLLVVTNTFID